MTLYCVDVTSDGHVAENIQLSLQLVKPERAVYAGFVFSSCQLLSTAFSLRRQSRLSQRRGSCVMNAEKCTEY